MILPPVSTSDTGGKFVTVVFIPVVHLHLRISPGIFEQILNEPNVIFGGLGENDSGKKPVSLTVVENHYLATSFRFNKNLEKAFS